MTFCFCILLYILPIYLDEKEESMTAKVENHFSSMIESGSKYTKIKFLTNGFSNKRYTYRMARHLFTFRDKARKARLTISEDAVVDVLKYTFKYSCLAETDVNYEKRALVFPSRDKKYFVGILIAIEDGLVTVVSMYDVPSDKYKKIALYSKEKKIFLDDYDLDAFVNEEEKKEKAYTEAYVRRNKEGIYKFDSYQEYLKSRIVFANPKTISVNGIRVVSTAKDKKKTLYSKILLDMANKNRSKRKKR